MAQLLRQLHKSYWAKYLDAPEWATGDCPPKILSDLVDKDGISTWFISDGWDVSRTISAIALGQNSVRDVLFALIGEQEVRALGIEIKPTEQDTVDLQVSKSHRDLMQVSAHKVAGLARLIRKEIPQALGKN